MPNKIAKPLSKFWKSLSVAWKALISLATALGILYGIYKLFTSGPNVEFIPTIAPTWGYWTDNGKQYAQYLVEVSIVNNGDKPYYPVNYKMKVSYGYKDAIYQPFSIPDTFHYPESVGPTKLSFDQKKDLTRVTKIEPDGIVTGFIWFRMELTPSNQMIDISHYNSIKFEIFDVNGKKVESKTFHYLPYIEGKRYSPQSGVETK